MIQMKSITKAGELFLSLIVLSLALTVSAVCADELQVDYSGTSSPFLNAGLLLTDNVQPSGSLSAMTQYMATFDESLKNSDSKGSVRNFSAVTTFVPIKSSLGTGGASAQIFNKLLNSYQAHPSTTFYPDSSPIYCFGG